jgi:hypothetical protein
MTPVKTEFPPAMLTTLRGRIAVRRGSVGPIVGLFNLAARFAVNSLYFALAEFMHSTGD